MLEHRFERAPATVVALHVETTGGRSERQRLVWVGLTRIVGGAVEQTFETLINPQARVPQHVMRRLALDPDELDAAPLAPAALAEVRSVVEDHPVVAHNALAQLSQLSYELLWHGLPPLRRDVLDTQQLAMQRWPDLARPGLEAIAARLGLRTPRAARHGLSRLVAEAYLKLALSEDAPLGGASHSISEPLELAYRALPPGAGIELPRLSGVYIFRDAAGTPLYVGKAASLRERVAQHFTGASRVTRLDDGLLARVAYVEHEVTATELGALLREAELIEAHRPPYNTQRAAHGGTPYLVLRDPPFLRGAAVAAPLDALEVYGPYASTRAVRDTIRTLATVFQLRTCLRALPTKKRRLRVPCIRLGMGLCPAPCTGELGVERYAAHVALARIFLRDGKDAALDALDARLGSADVPGWEHAMLSETRSRLLRVRREHRPVAQPAAAAETPRDGLTASQRNLLERWSWQRYAGAEPNAG